jgi:hypothetical protein
MMGLSNPRPKGGPLIGRGKPHTDTKQLLKDLLGLDEQGKRVPYKLGHFFLAINVENFIDY